MQSGSCVLQHGSEGAAAAGDDAKPMLFCLCVIQTRRVEGVRRGAVVRSIAVCSPYNFVDQLLPVLDNALSLYFDTSNEEVFDDLWRQLNAVDLARCPRLSKCVCPLRRVV